MVTETLAPVAVPVEPTTPIKPSEAIRLGCLIAPVQDFGRLGDGGKSACVMGAMVLGLGNDLGALRRVGAFAGAFSLDHGCPVRDCSWRAGNFVPVLPAHLNDDHRWTRERIADWLAERGL